MLGLGAAAIVVALGLGPSPGVDAATVLEWSAPAQCPAADRVQQWLGQALADSAADPAGMRARATVVQEGASLRLELSLDRPSGPVGRRTMQADDCEALAKATVLIVALAIDPEARVDTLPDEPAVDEPTEPQILVPPPTEPTPAPEDPPSEPEPVEPAPEVATPLAEPEPLTEPPPTEPTPSPTRPRVHGGLRAHAGAALAVLSSPTAVVSLTGVLEGRAWRTELGGSYSTPVETRLADGTGGRLQQWTIDARGCGVLHPGPLAIPLCGGLDVGATHALGRGVIDPQRVASLRLALAAGAALLWRPAAARDRVGLWIGGDLLVALVRARFRASPAATALVFHTPAVGGRVSAGIEVRFR